MSERHDRSDIELARERCFLVGVLVPGRYDEHEEPLAELASLIDTAGGEVVGQITQKMDKPHRRTFLGKGKLADMVDQAIECKADTVIIDDHISPSQLGAIEDACHRKVIDRSEVIIDIFSARARSHQAKLQVELAQLQYEMPRLTRKWTHLERLGGGMGTRGPGEAQIETDRRLIRRKISILRRELETINKRKESEVAGRGREYTVCLVGYTNAGKSSLLNQLTAAATFTEDRLFATLDTLTRRLELDDNQTVLISDTVGFIRRLPHHLVASFHATLEEAAQADLLLHVVDGADPLAGTYARAVDETLKQLGMTQHQMVYIINKADAAPDPVALAGLHESLRPSLVVSAKTGAGCVELLMLLHDEALAGQSQQTLRFSAGDGKRLAMINQHGSVSETKYDDADVIVTVILSPENLARLKSLPGEMVVL